MAARRIVCFVSEMDAKRAFRGRVAVLAIVFFVLAGPTFPGFSTFASNPEEHSRDHKPTYLLHASLNETTLEEKFEDYLGAEAQTQSNPAQAQEFIERIDWGGLRRIRRDTVNARIFSRVNDPYNEETLRRDFQALWNTQFFEDVKLRVEDSPDKPGGKIITWK